MRKGQILSKPVPAQFAIQSQPYTFQPVTLLLNAYIKSKACYVMEIRINSM
jgi:hypothetical protein